ncbi:MAG: hypothetical protein COA44_11160 [Arcobacter sp.]|nr:MAG: hypothetical protein COA44_11160 [Arcobacter sp.]
MKKFSLIMFLCLTYAMAENIEVLTQGEILVNGKALNSKDSIKYGDTIETKKGASFRFKVGKEAFLVSGKSKFSLKKEKGTNIFELVSGSVMGVFAKGKHKLKTPNMTAGIRGTGVYAKIKDGKTYFCICYGSTGIEVKYATESEVLSAKHHNMVWVTDDLIKHTAHMEFHTDDELRGLEKMVGRVPAFDK